MTITRESLPALGELLYDRRRDRGLTQKQVAERAGISHVTVCRIELAEIESPRFADIVGICNALGMEVEITEGRR